MKTCLLLAGTALAVLATPADAQRARQITPYIEVGQVLTADLDGPNGDVLTYTSLAAGVDASIQTSRVEVQVNYRFEKRIGWGEDVADSTIHSGLARAALRLNPGLNIEGGALATRARDDIRGAAPGNLAGNVSNVSQLYSAYVGPTYATQIDQAALNAAYRFGYTKVEQPSLPAFLPGQPQLDNYDSSTNHMAVASIGTRAGTYLPIGVTLSGAWEREDVSQLDQRYDGTYARVDTVLPVTGTFAVTAGLGYENIEINQRDALVDVTGFPVQDTNGRFITDPASPRRLSYETDGLFWDAGVLWRPSARTALTARVGRRYDTMSYTGSFDHQVSSRPGLNIGVYDSIDSVGRGLSDTLAALPTSYVATNDAFGDQFGGCVFGQQGATVDDDGPGGGVAAGTQGAGACLTPLLGSLTTASFRSRGITGVLSTSAGPWGIGLGVGYANRKFLVPNAGPSSILAGTSDDIYFGQFNVNRTLTARSNIGADLFINYFDPGLVNAPGVLGAGANTTYSYSFGRLGATASVGVFTFDQDQLGSDVSGQALLGMRYSF